MKNIVFIFIFGFVIVSNAQEVIWYHSIENAKVEAERTNRLILVDLYSDRIDQVYPYASKAKPNFKLQKLTTERKEFIVKHYVLVRINTDVDRRFGQSSGIRESPHVIIMNAKGDLIFRLEADTRQKIKKSKEIYGYAKKYALKD